MSHLSCRVYNGWEWIGCVMFDSVSQWLWTVRSRNGCWWIWMSRCVHLPASILSNFLVPSFVREMSGSAWKSWISPWTSSITGSISMTATFLSPYWGRLLMLLVNLIFSLNQKSLAKWKIWYFIFQPQVQRKWLKWLKHNLLSTVLSWCYWENIISLFLVPNIYLISKKFCRLFWCYQLHHLVFFYFLLL